MLVGGSPEVTTSPEEEEEPRADDDDVWDGPLKHIIQVQ